MDSLVHGFRRCHELVGMFLSAASCSDLHELRMCVRGRLLASWELMRRQMLFGGPSSRVVLRSSSSSSSTSGCGTSPLRAAVVAAEGLGLRPWTNLSRPARCSAPAAGTRWSAFRRSAIWVSFSFVCEGHAPLGYH